MPGIALEAQGCEQISPEEWVVALGPLALGMAAADAPAKAWSTIPSVAGLDNSRP